LDNTPLPRTPRRTPHILLLVLLTALVACGRPAAQAPAPTATWWSVRVAPTATVAPVATSTAPADVPTPLPTATPLTQPAVISAYVTAYLPGWGERPSGMALLDGRVYVANQRTHNVSVIAGDAVKRVVPVGALPGAMAADPASGRVFVLSHADRTVAVLEKDAVVATWELAEAGSALAVAGGRLWVGSAEGRRISLLATDDGTRLGEVSLDTSGSVIAIAPSADGAILYVASHHRTTAVDVATLSEIANITLNSYGTLAVSVDGSRVYTNHFDPEEGSSYLVALDAASLTEVRRLPVPPDPSAALAAPDGERVYLLSSHANALLVVDGAAMEPLASIPVGLEPQHLVLDAASGALYVANRQSDSVTIIDAVGLEARETIPLSAHIEDLEVDPVHGALYAAVSSSDRVLAFDADGLRSAWYVGRHPGAVAVLPHRDAIAVLLRSEARLALLNPGGEEAASYPTGRNPMGLTVDATRERIYAGDLLVDPATGVTETLRIATIQALTTEEPPMGVTIDTRRGRAYALAFSGVPGTSGGTVAALLADGAASQADPAPGRLGVVQLLYDADMDRFYATVAHLAGYGLQVTDAETLAEVAFVPLDRRPSAAALNGTTRHLWLALTPPDDAAADTRLVAIDTRTLGTAAEITVDGRVRSLAVDTSANLVYAGVDGMGDILVVQDVAMPAPPRPANLQAPAPTASATPETAPTAAETPPTPATPTCPATTIALTPTPVPVISPTPTREEPCSMEVDPRLQDAYAQLGAEAMGCPRADAVFGIWAWQPFERGELLWHRSSAVIYVFAQDGSWRGYTDEWHEAMPELSCEAHPPEGRLQPIRGFGRIWCLVGEVQEAVGWALDPEVAIDGISQEFDGGTLVQRAGVARLLRGDGTWVAP
jgi:YVTN family beta-propeller protein